MRTKSRVGRIAAPLQRRQGAMLAGKAESEHAGIVESVSQSGPASAATYRTYTTLTI